MVECRSLSGFHWLGAALRYLREAVGMRVFLPWVLVTGGLFAQHSLSVAGGFENTGSLAVAHSDHTATFLPNGKVLIVGGATPEPRTAELYDQASGTWTGTGSTTSYRVGHTATLLPNGKVLVAGSGDGVHSDRSAELYDPASETWTATGNLTSMRGRGDHTATLLPNGKVLVAGGFYIVITINGESFSLDTAELYDPVSGTWTATGSLATARQEHTATLLPDGRVLVVGGRDYDSTSYDEYLASAELYDPGTGTWATTGSLGTARAGHTATLLPNGKVLVAGGVSNYQIGITSSAELYDPATETWTSTGSLATERTGHTATWLASNKVLVVGGLHRGGYLSSAELYDVATGSWTLTGSLATERAVHTATWLPNNKVLVAGGYNLGPGALASAELYSGPPLLLNISTRLRVLTGDNAMIGGLIVTGNVSKKLIIRAIGPSLTALGISGALSDPTLELHDSSGATVHNDDWQTTIISEFGADQSGEISDSGLAPLDPHESAMIVNLIPGPYTAVVRGKNDGTGVALVEVYDLDPAGTSKLGNISTRGFVDTGDNAMIGGFVVDGGTAGGAAWVIVRALGPSVPVAGALADPTLELRDGSGTLVDSNDNWKTRPDGSSQQAEIEATGIPPTNDLESALVKTLAPGNYTAIMRGKNNTTGVGLVEVYNLQ